MGQRPGTEPRDKRMHARPEADVKQRAEELSASGMPIQMAMAVAHGRMALNEALERLARRDRVNQLMERHQLSRALATQIALGQASLDAVLARRRMQEHRESHRLRSVLDEHAESGDVVTLMLHGHRRVTGRIVSVASYALQFSATEPEPAAAPEDIHKLQVKLAFHPDAYKRLRKVMKYDKELEKTPKGPIERPQDRYTCSDRRLFRYMDDGVEVVATLLEGEQLRGTVQWFGRYEFGLALKGEAEVTVFRHALADLRESTHK